MEIETTPIYQEIKQIIDEGPKPVNYNFKAKIHVDDKEFEAMRLVDIDFTKDYIKAYADNTIISLVIPLGLWAKVIYPNLHILDISIIKTPLYETSDDIMLDGEVLVQRFTAIPVTPNLPVITGSNLDRLSIQALDLKDMLTIQFQLIDKSIEKLRMVTVGGIFRRTTPEDLIKGVLHKESVKVKTSDGPAVKYVDMVKASNDEEREHYVIPHATPIVNLAHHVQQYAGGVYNTGINCYYYDHTWFVYPLYNVERYQSASRKLTIVKVPKQSYTGIERTFREDGDIVYVLGTSESNFKDNSLSNTLNEGDGFRFADSRKFLRDIVEKKDNKAIIERDKVNHEFIFSKKRERPDNKRIQNVKLTGDRISSNPFVHKSKLAELNGSTYEFDWENSDPSLLIPGMMVRILYLDVNEMKELFGVLLLAHSSIQMRGSGMMVRKHITNTKLVIFGMSIVKQDNERQDPQDEAAIQNWLDYTSI